MTCRIAFRTDSSFTLGTGHLFRCMTLADALRRKGALVFFICADLPGNLNEFIENQGYVVRHVPPRIPADKGMSSPSRPHWSGIDWKIDAENTIAVLAGVPKLSWLITDHYALDTRWEGQMRAFTGKIMIIDDLADRLHDCDLLLDQNLYDGLELRYDGLVPDHCVRLLGPRYALLRPEFAAARKTLRYRDGRVRRILVFFGGSDLTNETGKTLAAIGSLGQINISMDVVTGATNPHKEDIREQCSSLPHTFFHSQVSTMADLMARSDLIIGAGGATTWERCYLGVPSITVVIANNQHETTKAVAAAGATWYLGRNDEVSLEALATAVKRLLGNPPLVRDMGRRALEVMGGTSFIGSKILVDAIVGDDHAEA